MAEKGLYMMKCSDCNVAYTYRPNGQSSNQPWSYPAATKGQKRSQSCIPCYGLKLGIFILDTPSNNLRSKISRSLHPHSSCETKMPSNVSSRMSRVFEIRDKVLNEKYSQNSKDQLKIGKVMVGPNSILLWVIRPHKTFRRFSISSSYSKNFSNKMRSPYQQ